MATAEAPQHAPADRTPTPGTRTAHDDPLLGCLQLLTKMQGRPLSGDALTAGLPLVDERLTPALFVRAAARAGLAARLVQRPLAKIGNLVLPAVLLLRQGGACILERRLDDGRLRIVQPESGGQTEVDESELAALYTGRALFLRPQHHFDARTRDTVMPRPHRWFRDVLTGAWPIYSEVVVASLLINLFAIASPLFIMNVYDRVVPNHALETLWVLASGVMVVFGFDLVMRMLRGYFIDVAGKRVDILLSATLFERVLGIRMAARPPSVGAFANNLHEFETFRDFFTSASLSALIDLPFVLLFVFIIWLLGGPLAWIPAAVLPLALLAGYLIQIPLGRIVQDLFRHSAQKQAALIETLTGLETIKSLSAEGGAQRRWEQSIGAIARVGLKARFLSASAVNITVFLQQAATVFVVVAGVYLIANGDLSVGALVACTILTGRALAPLAQIAATLTRFHQARASLHAIDNLMNLPLERPQERSFLHRPAFSGEIEFKDVRFSYPGQRVEALNGLSFRVRPGERVAIIGRIGSGKTTIEKLLLGLYEPASGSVLIDGTDTRQVDPADLRRNIGYVPQDITLFYGSVKDNIVLGMPYADDANVLRAAEIAGVTDFVNRHPEGFDLQVGERGDGLSGGQRQAIAVARALLSDPPIVVMDEPSNAMDNTTEELFKSKLALWLNRKTLLLVTHRASLLSLVNRIIVVDSGHVVADGPKEQVLEALKQGHIRVAKS